MDNILTTLFSWQFVLFCLAVTAVVYVFRILIESFNKVKDSKTWRDRFLPVLPMIFGALTGLVASKFPYPSGINVTSGRVMFGLVAGLLSGLVYKVVKSFLGSKISKETKESPDSIPPIALPSGHTEENQENKSDTSKPEAK